VEPDGIEPTTSSMPLLWIFISGHSRSVPVLSKPFKVRRF
jgi:hypothetical protein